MDNSVKLLDESQTQNFDVEYIDDKMFDYVTHAIDDYMADTSHLTMIDVGGGNGSYTDRVLNHYRDMDVVLVEPDEYLRKKNQPHPNKHVISATMQTLRVPSNSFDIVEFNWVLHHFVGKSMRKTLKLQEKGLQKAFQLLKPGGMVIVFENFYEGLVASDLPGKLIYQFTASSLLAPITRNMGANTAGTGVCFHSRKIWQRMLEDCGFEVKECHQCYEFGNLSTLKRIALNIKNQRVGCLIGIKPENVPTNRDSFQ